MMLGVVPGNPIRLMGGLPMMLNLMVVEGFRHVQMVDNMGNLVGMATMRDLMEYLSDFFSRDILNLPPDPRVVFRTREGG